MADQAEGFKFHQEWLAKKVQCSVGKVKASLKRLKTYGYTSTITLHEQGRISRHIALNRELVIAKKTKVKDRHIQKKMYNEHIEEVEFDEPF